MPMPIRRGAALPRPQAETEALLAKADSDRSGQLSLTEFRDSKFTCYLNPNRHGPPRRPTAARPPAPMS